MPRAAKPIGRSGSRGNYSAAPIFANGRILFLNETSKATWVKTRKQSEQLGENQVSGRTLATPAFSDGAMFDTVSAKRYRIRPKS